MMILLLFYENPLQVGLVAVVFFTANCLPFVFILLSYQSSDSGGKPMEKQDYSKVVAD